jgi:hypothetical protein
MLTKYNKTKNTNKKRHHIHKTTKYVVTTTYINRGLDYVSKYTTRTRSALSGMFTSSWYTHLIFNVALKFIFNVTLKLFLMLH